MRPCRPKGGRQRVMPAMRPVWRCLAAMRWLAVTTLAWIDRSWFRWVIPAADRNSANNAQDYQADHRPGHMHEISELCLSNLLQFCFSGAGLLQPQLPGEISATRDRRDSRTDL